MGLHGKGEGARGDTPLLEVIRLRSVGSSFREIGCRQILVDTVELGNVTLVTGIMRVTVKNYRLYSLTARDARDGVLHAIAELQEISASILA